MPVTGGIKQISNITKKFNICEELFLQSLKLKNYGVLILNSPTKLVSSCLWNIWNQGKIRVLVDGGAESWISWKNSSREDRLGIAQPHLVTGDFDSISSETLEKFKLNEHVQVIHTPDQNATDFTKALIELNDYRKKKNIKIESIFVITQAVEGRLDHIMANINTLFWAEKNITDLTVFTLSSDSMSWLLAPGTYSISIPQVVRNNKSWCALLPVGSPAVVTTSGLKWNLDKTKTSFGDLVSTSNTYDGSPAVTIQTNSPLLWSMSTSGLECI